MIGKLAVAVGASNIRRNNGGIALEVFDGYRLQRWLRPSALGPWDIQLIGLHRDPFLHLRDKRVVCEIDLLAQS
jgi:hypothetical protein